MCICSIFLQGCRHPQVKPRQSETLFHLWGLNVPSTHNRYLVQTRCNFSTWLRLHRLRADLRNRVNRWWNVGGGIKKILKNILDVCHFFTTFLFPYFVLLQLNLTNDYEFGNLKLFNWFLKRNIGQNSVKTDFRGPEIPQYVRVEDKRYVWTLWSHLSAVLTVLGQWRNIWK